MIRIHKAAQAPAVLQRRGTAKAKQHCSDYDATPARQRRALRFEFTEEIYRHESVKVALRAAQHDKCAFCESKFSHVGYGDIEHFRPKAGYCQREGAPLRRPGYYWLAYEWDNLFYSCQLCNQRFKRNLFPLRNSRKRARSHHDAVDREEPWLIDPGRDDPAAFLRFREEVAEAPDDNLVGTTTISVLGLNRLELTEVRRQRFAPVRLLLQVRRSLAAQPATSEVQRHLKDIDTHLHAITKDEAEYAAMMRALLAAPGPGPE
ncbi:MAG TPA: hypothetical protein VFE78_36140 [Gemmataceae bacterium]|nr:hypothetical protein [Gemmataceae bacterium]